MTTIIPELTDAQLADLPSQADGKSLQGAGGPSSPAILLLSSK